MKDKTTIILMSCIIAGLLMVISFWGYDKFIENQEAKIQNASIIAYQQGQLYIISQITETGNIPYLSNSTGNWTIKTATLEELCRN